MDNNIFFKNLLTAALGDDMEEENDMEEMMDQLEDGDIVEFTFNGGRMLGNIEYVMTEGFFGLPGSKFYIEASMEDPVVLIRIWSGGEETELMVGRKASEITKIES